MITERKNYKVELQREKVHPHFVNNPKIKHRALTHALPYYRSGQGSYIHRVRSGHTNTWDDGDSAHCFQLWCGASGSVAATRRPDRPRGGRRGGELFAQVPEHSVLCATCEGRAIGAGQTDSRMLNGRFVAFCPRTASPASFRVPAPDPVVAFEPSVRSEVAEVPHRVNITLKTRALVERGLPLVDPMRKAVCGEWIIVADDTHAHFVQAGSQATLCKIAEPSQWAYATMGAFRCLRCRDSLQVLFKTSHSP